jgi:hypothetical protein
MSEGTQAGLTSFEPDSSTGSNESTDSTSTNAAGSQSGYSDWGSNPLGDLYVDIAEGACRQYPVAVQECSLATNVEPSWQAVTTDMPEGLPGLPKRVGPWRLLDYDGERIRYHATGVTYDERYGKGGGNQVVELYLNNSGVNRDGTYRIRLNEIVGYEHEDKIRNHTPSDGERLSKCRWFSPGENTGDRGVGSASIVKTEEFYDGVVELLLFLHFTPAPFYQHLPEKPDRNWELKRMSPLSATYTAQVDAGPKETLKLLVTNSKVRLSAYDESDSGTERLRGEPRPQTEFEEVVYDAGSNGFDSLTGVSALTVAERVISSQPDDIYATGGFDE